MTRSQALRDHVALGILDIAATVLAEHGEAASMADIAKAAGVGRATLYRYFPSRAALLQALSEAALADLSARIADAGLDAAPIDEAIARLTRAVVAAISKYRALALLEKSTEQEAQTKEQLIAPFQPLFERAVDEGAFRTDLSAPTLIGAYVALLQGAASQVVQGQIGVEEASGAITSIFLTGVSASPDRR